MNIIPPPRKPKPFLVYQRHASIWPVNGPRVGPSFKPYQTIHPPRQALEAKYEAHFQGYERQHPRIKEEDHIEDLDCSDSFRASNFGLTEAEIQAGPVKSVMEAIRNLDCLTSFIESNFRWNEECAILRSLPSTSCKPSNCLIVQKNSVGSILSLRRSWSKLALSSGSPHDHLPQGGRGFREGTQACHGRHQTSYRKRTAEFSTVNFNAVNFNVSEYTDPTGRKLPMYLMTRALNFEETRIEFSSLFLSAPWSQAFLPHVPHDP